MRRGIIDSRKKKENKCIYGGIYWLLIDFDRLIDWLVCWLTNWLNDWLADWVLTITINVDWLIDWLIDQLIDWLIDRVLTINVTRKSKMFQPLFQNFQNPSIHLRIISSTNIVSAQ